ncbi:MAG: hypothetical protein KF833_08115 [Verrucomicrobiae bacterium]|nr:hypothetical protein [Verrucomicrobiae bacterium]
MRLASKSGLLVLQTVVLTATGAIPPFRGEGRVVQHFSYLGRPGVLETDFGFAVSNQYWKIWLANVAIPDSGSQLRKIYAADGAQVVGVTLFQPTETINDGVGQLLEGGLPGPGFDPMVGAIWLACCSWSQFSGVRAPDEIEPVWVSAVEPRLAGYKMRSEWEVRVGEPHLPDWVNYLDGTATGKTERPAASFRSSGRLESDTGLDIPSEFALKIYRASTDGTALEPRLQVSGQVISVTKDLAGVDLGLLPAESKGVIVQDFRGKRAGGRPVEYLVTNGVVPPRDDPFVTFEAEKQKLYVHRDGPPVREPGWGRVLVFAAMLGLMTIFLTWFWRSARG